MADLRPIELAEITDAPDDAVYVIERPSIGFVNKITALNATKFFFNTVTVDTVNGDDATAIKYNRRKPFKTLQAADTAAVLGDTVEVFPGPYTTFNVSAYDVIGKNGVNWYFYVGTTIDAIFEDGGSTHTYAIDGAADFVKTQDDSDSIFKYTGDGSNITVHFNTMLNTSGEGNCFEINNQTATTSSYFSLRGVKLQSDPQYSILVAGKVDGDINVADLMVDNAHVVLCTTGWDGVLNNRSEITCVTGTNNFSSGVFMTSTVLATSVFNQWGDINYIGSNATFDLGVLTVDAGIFHHWSGKINSTTKTAIKSGESGNGVAEINLHGTDIEVGNALAIFNSNPNFVLNTKRSTITSAATAFQAIEFRSTMTANMDGKVINTGGNQGILMKGGAVNLTIDNLEVQSTTNSVNSDTSNQAIKIIHDLVVNAPISTNVTAIQTSTPTGTTQTIDWGDGKTQDLSLVSATGTVDLTFANGVDGTEYTLFIFQGAVARNLSLTNTLVPGGGGSIPNAITVTATNAATDILKVTAASGGFFLIEDLKDF